MSDRRLIEEWLPIAELGIEGTRERTPMTPFPAPNRLHVWWARRLLVASRAAVLASLLPADADRKQFLHCLGIHGDPVKAKKRIEQAKREKKNLGPSPYGYKRAFSHTPDNDDRHWVRDSLGVSPNEIVVLDPTAGGGSIPLETMRLGFRSVVNDLNPVAALLLRATVECLGVTRKCFRNSRNLRSGSCRRPSPGIGASSLLSRRATQWSVTSGRGQCGVRTVPGWCRCRRTGGWRRAVSACG